MRQRNLFFIFGTSFLILFFSSFVDAKSDSFEVSIPQGTQFQGCEETNQCYIPYEIGVRVGDKITWRNDDTAVHTVTSGTLESDNWGMDFDSSLIISGDLFSHTFVEEGVFEYLCMIHPWMTGIVNVQPGSGGNYIPPPITNIVTLNIANSFIRGETSLHLSGKVDPVKPSEDEVKIFVLTKSKTNQKQILQVDALVKPDGSYDLDIGTGGAVWNENEGDLQVLAKYSDYPGATKDIRYEKVDESSPTSSGIDPLLVVGAVIVIGSVIVAIMVLKKRKRPLTQTLRDSKLK